MTKKNDTGAGTARKLRMFGPGKYDKLAPAFDFIPGWLQDHSVAMIYSPPQSGKTFFAIYLLCCTAIGRPVFNLKVEKRAGLYIGLEGEAGIKSRIMACCAQIGIDTSPIHYAVGAFDIRDTEQREALIDYMERHGIQFLVIDTLSRAMTGTDENVAKEMSPVIDALHEIKERTGACVVAITHTGKDVAAGIRGWSGQLGNVDTTIEVVAHCAPNEEPRPDTPRTARVRKQRDIEAGGVVSFKLAVHDTPVRNARGEKVRSVALDEHERFTDLETAKPPKPVSESDREANDVLTSLIAKHEKLGIGAPTPDHFRKALKRAGWRKTGRDGKPVKPATWRKAWERVCEKLQLDSNGGIEHAL